MQIHNHIISILHFSIFYARFSSRNVRAYFKFPQKFPIKFNFNLLQTHNHRTHLKLISQHFNVHYTSQNVNRFFAGSTARRPTLIEFCNLIRTQGTLHLLRRFLLNRYKSLASNSNSTSPATASINHYTFFCSAICSQ